ncbi:MAG: hypothetical protein AMJ63_10045 [Myxococcales bacterium SG8_38_1]|jgi:hypothetical protein|nr:MAG: hypothetical protein AMJ63_10045 [Myxococcales bacterium SG8_38_1]
MESQIPARRLNPQLVHSLCARDAHEMNAGIPSSKLSLVSSIWLGKPRKEAKIREGSPAPFEGVFHSD